MDTTQMDTVYAQNEVILSDVMMNDIEEYDNVSFGDSDSEATICAIDDMYDDLDDDKFDGLSAEDLFQLIMNDHHYMDNTLAGGDGDHIGLESPIPNAADIQNFFLKAMNLAAFEPFKDDELKMKCSACSSKCGLTLPLDKLTKKLKNKQKCGKKHGSDSCSERSRKSRRSHGPRSKETAEKPTSSSKTSESSGKTPESSAKTPETSVKTPESYAKTSESTKKPIPSKKAEAVITSKDGPEMTIEPSRWTSECKAVFEKVQQTSYLGCALTLLEKMWDNYLNSSFEKIRQEEIERARSVDFCNDVTQMIEDGERYVSQVIEEMEPTTFTTSFVI